MYDIIPIVWYHSTKFRYVATTKFVGCLTPYSTFSNARDCTTLLAADQTEIDAVNDAWDAVGVLSPQPTLIVIGVSEPGLVGNGGSVKEYMVDVGCI